MLADTKRKEIHLCASVISLGRLLGHLLAELKIPQLRCHLKEIIYSFARFIGYCGIEPEQKQRSVREDVTPGMSSRL